MENNFITHTIEISELKLNKLTNSYYFNFKYNISDNEYKTVDLTGYNAYQSEGIRKDFIDMISNMSKVASDLSKQIENGDILNTSHNIKLEGQKPVNNEPFTLWMYTNDFSDIVKQQIKDLKEKPCEFLELTDTQQEARERRITIDELKQQINKLSEKNKKLKSKNRKLKKQLTIINTGE